jgi:hypothetical protein
MVEGKLQVGQANSSEKSRPREGGIGCAKAQTSSGEGRGMLWINAGARGGGGGLTAVGGAAPAHGDEVTGAGAGAGYRGSEVTRVGQDRREGPNELAGGFPATRLRPGAREWWRESSG